MGHFSDGTPFTEVDVESIGDILEENVIMKDMEMKFYMVVFLVDKWM